MGLTDGRHEYNPLHIHRRTKKIWKSVATWIYENAIFFSISRFKTLDREYAGFAEPQVSVRISANRFTNQRSRLPLKD